MLPRSLAVVQQGRYNPAADRTTFADLAKLIDDDYVANGRRSRVRLRNSLDHLRDAFGSDRAVNITSARVLAYRRQRLDAGAAPGTVQNEVAALKRMFSLGLDHGLVTHTLRVKRLELHNVRTGFFEEPEYRALLRHLPEYLQHFVSCLYLTGWRSGEVRALTWAQIDFAAGIIRLEPGTTKNEEGRTFPFAILPPLAALLSDQHTYTQTVAKETGTIVPWVFHRDGRPIGDVRKAWAKACRAAGLAGRIPHDFRRTAVRNLERAGVSRSVAMKLTGHKTENVYRRYAIVSEADLSAGVAKLATLHRGAADVSPIRSARKR